MCGIVGLVGREASWTPEQRRLRAMMEAVAHRGPDDEGTWLQGPVALGHKRLSIIDLTTGHQPMSNEDGSVWIVFNGEIYNYLELRRDLLRAHQFRTQSDTEVILHLYEELGERCLERLNGMFAFFVWDEEAGVGFAARDRLGVKPFWFCREPFRFASEAKALVGSAPRIHLESVLEYLAAPCFSGVEHAMFDGIEALPAGHWLRVSRDGIEIRRWWEYRLEPDDVGVRELRRALEGAFRRSTVADEPVGAFLSGGIDSTLMCAVARPSVAFTVRFEDQDRFDRGASLIVGSDDTPFAALAARELGLTQELVPVERGGLAGDLERVAAINDALPAWEQELAQLHLSRAASRRVKAVLVGDAADETHFGYHFLLDGAPLSTLIRRFSRAPIRREVLADPVAHFDAKYRDLAAHDDPVIAATILIVKRWLSRLLHNGDIHPMAHSLEARVPYADAELLDVARRVRAPAGAGKALLREAARGIIPDAVRLRTKSALPKDPLVDWRGPALAAVDECAVVRELLDVDAVRAAGDDEVDRALLFRVAALGAWCRHYGVRP
jgi:asparagine synthase (glutamine-hydrolysing)